MHESEMQAEAVTRETFFTCRQKAGRENPGRTGGWDVWSHAGSSQDVTRGG